MIYEVENNNLAVDHSRISVVDFNAEWCGPCKALHPILEEIANEHPEIDVYFVDVDMNEELAAQYNIRSIPTLVYHREDGNSARTSGIVSKAQILENLGLN